MTIPVKIHAADYITSAPGLRECPDTGGAPEIVLVGRSNVGKSSFINSMTGRKNLARTSNTPGKTRHLNFYRIEYTIPAEIGEGPQLLTSAASLTDVDTRRVNGSPADNARRSLYFVDLPGYGYAKVSKSEQQQWQRNLQNYLLKRESIVLVIQLIDARHGALDSDIQMFEWLQRHGRRTQVLLTKTDKLSRNETTRHLAATAQALDLLPADILPFSAETHLNREAIWRMVIDIQS